MKETCNTEKPSEHRKNTSIAFSRHFWDVVKSLAALTTIGSILLYVMGISSQQAYLQSWGVDHGLFGKSSDWLLYTGYHVLIDRMALLFTAITSELWGMLLVATIAGALIGGLMYWKNSPESDRTPPRWLTEKSRGLIECTLLVPMGFLMLFVGLLLAILLGAFPGLIGEAYGKELAKKQYDRLNLECPKESTDSLHCVSLRVGDQIVARGFLIESSNTHVAIYDVDEQRTRALERQGTELRSEPRLRIKQPNKDD